jgi:hypothetical protein
MRLEHQLCQPQVGDLCFPAVADKHVGALEVAVDNRRVGGMLWMDTAAMSVKRDVFPKTEFRGCRLSCRARLLPIYLS